jgi:hypothetical protein
MTQEIDWEAVARVELREGAPERPAAAVKTLAKHAPIPAKPAPKKRGKPAK